MRLENDTMTSKCFMIILQLILIICQFQATVCKQSDHRPTHSKDRKNVVMRSTIFDSRVLDKVKTLFTGSLQTIAKTTSQTGQKKSIITTANLDKTLHVKIDPRQFGSALLNKANENAARKSDIFMNKAIDATALGVAVLKLIFGKDAKMVMKDTKSVDTSASVRTNEPRPQITAWTPNNAQIGERKSLKEDKTTNSKGTGGIGTLSTNILKLVQNLQPSNGEQTNDKMISSKDTLAENIASEGKEKAFTGSENNLEKLLSLMQESKIKQMKGDKKSWVLLHVPSKQPKDELGMLTDPAATEDSSDDDRSQHRIRKIHTRKKQHKKKESHRKQSSTRLVTKIQEQVKHLADLVKKQNSVGVKESFIHSKRHKRPKSSQQSFEGKSFTTWTRVGSKTLKSEPVQEVNAVKTDKTNYENSVKNLLEALKTSAQKHSSEHVSRYEEEGRYLRPRQHKINLVPVKKKEEHASSKDVVGGTNPAGGAVVSLDALRQLGQLLGLSSQHSDEKKVSPYTGTEDTLTLATPMPPQVATPTPTPIAPPTPPPTSPASPAQDNVNQQNSLTRISEQLKMFAERGLRGHNDYRKLHHAEPLKWSEDLASAAEKLAYQAAKKGSTRRSELVERKGYGESVAKIPNIALENAGEEATRHWYNEKQNFTFSDPVIGEGTKAFTQIIWKGTKTLGMGAAKDDDTGELYVVALYSPKGNDQATLRENIVADGEQHTDVYASIFKKSYAARHD